MLEDENITMRPPLLAGGRGSPPRGTPGCAVHVHREHGVDVLDGRVGELGVLGIQDPRAGHHDVRRRGGDPKRTASRSDTSTVTATERWSREPSSATMPRTSALVGWTRS
jgi:hypothetical protein